MVILDELSVRYRRRPALLRLSGRLAKGSLTAVVGPNGAGKSTLLKSIIGLLPCAPCSVRLSAPPERRAYLPQLAEIDRGFPMSVRDAVLLGAWPRLGAWGGADASEWQRVDDALAEVGLAGFEYRPLGSLSNGQFQRVMFARLIVQDAELILLDEPFGAMDRKTTATLLSLVHRWHADGRTVVAVLHDDAQVISHFPQTLLLARQCIAWGATADVMTPELLHLARATAEAWDDTPDEHEPTAARPTSGAVVPPGSESRATARAAA
jgi:zinc/manganese transport system ATP-binding protein